MFLVYAINEFNVSILLIVVWSHSLFSPCLSVLMSACISASLSVCISVCLSASLLRCLSICLLACLSLYGILILTCTAKQSQGRLIHAKVIMTQLTIRGFVLSILLWLCLCIAFLSLHPNSVYLSLSPSLSIYIYYIITFITLKYTHKEGITLKAYPERDAKQIPLNYQGFFIPYL